MNLGYDVAGWNASNVTSDGSIAQKDYEFNPGRLERLDAGSHVDRGAMDHVNKSTFHSTIFHSSMDCFGALRGKHEPSRNRTPVFGRG